MAMKSSYTTRWDTIVASHRPRDKSEQEVRQIAAVRSQGVVRQAFFQPERIYKLFHQGVTHQYSGLCPVRGLLL